VHVCEQSAGCWVCGFGCCNQPVSNHHEFWETSFPQPQEGKTGQERSGPVGLYSFRFCFSWPWPLTLDMSSYLTYYVLHARCVGSDIPPPGSEELGVYVLPRDGMLCFQSLGKFQVFWRFRRFVNSCHDLLGRHSRPEYGLHSPSTVDVKIRGCMRNEGAFGIRIRFSDATHL
jgi:hypothetical protein